MRAKFLSLILGVLVALCESYGAIAIADTQASAAETDADVQASVSAQIEPNWNATGFIGRGAAVDKLVVLVSVKLAPDGTIDPASLTVSVNDPSNPYAKQVMDSCRRAILITRQLKLPPGKTYARMSFRFPIADLH